MGVLEQAARFAAVHGRTVTSGGFTWSYYRLGTGPVIVWLTGGLRRAGLGYALLDDLASDHTVVALDYPPMRTVDEFERTGNTRVTRWPRFLVRGLLGVVRAPEDELAAWQDVVRRTVDDLGRPDIVSHFAVVADVIRRRLVTPVAFRSWTGRAAVLAARNDPTQHPRDLTRLESLLGRPVRLVDLGDRGHTAGLAYPEEYGALLRQAIA